MSVFFFTVCSPSNGINSMYELLSRAQSQFLMCLRSTNLTDPPRKRFEWHFGVVNGPPAGVQASYSGVTVPSFHSMRISPRCKAGVEWGRRMACSVSGARSLGTGEPGTLASGRGVYDFRTHTTFLLLVDRNTKKMDLLFSLLIT